MQKEEAGEELLQKINIKTRGSFEAVLIENNICPLCIYKNQVSDLVIRNGEKICLNCGFASDIISFSQHDGPRISMQSKRVNELAFNKGLGGTLGEKGRFCVLAKTVGLQDLPIRSRQIKIITEMFDAPKIRTMLRLGMTRCREWGLADDVKRASNVIFSNYFGHVLRRIGAYMTLLNENISRQLVDACFAFSLKAVKGEKAYNDAVERLNVDLALVDAVAWIYKKTKFHLKPTNTGSDVDTLCIDIQEKDN
jgi:hypothetical protein